MQEESARRAERHRIRSLLLIAVQLGTALPSVFPPITHDDGLLLRQLQAPGPIGEAIPGGMSRVWPPPPRHDTRGEPTHLLKRLPTDTGLYPHVPTALPSRASLLPLFPCHRVGSLKSADSSNHQLGRRSPLSPVGSQGIRARASGGASLAVAHDEYLT